MSFQVWMLVIGALLIALTLSGTLLQRLPLSPAMIYLVGGCALGPAGWGLMTPDPLLYSTILERVTEVAVLISLFAVGLKLGLPLAHVAWRLPLRLALVSMSITVAAITAIGAVRIHPTAIVEEGVQIGDGTSVWDAVHIRHGARIGEQCIVGEKSYIAYDVRIGDRVKINAMVYICAAVTIEDGVMISASTTFTNDRFPRATTPDLRALRSSDPDEHTLPTLVCEGATIGAGCTIGNDLVIGRWAMVGMGSLVTRSIPDFHLAIGHPARSIGCLCRCGEPFLRFKDGPPPDLSDRN